MSEPRRALTRIELLEAWLDAERNAYEDATLTPTDRAAIADEHVRILAINHPGMTDEYWLNYIKECHRHEREHLMSS